MHCALDAQCEGKAREDELAQIDNQRRPWVVIMMEFFERGSYYGVMSVRSVYLGYITASCWEIGDVVAD